MQDSGYSEEDINNYINYMQNDQSYEESGEPDVDIFAPEEQPTMEPNQYEDTIRRQQAEIDALKAGQSRISTDHLKDKLQENIERVFKGNDKINSLLETIKRLNGDEGINDRSTLIKREIEKEAMDLLNKRKNKGGTFDFSWFTEETNNAAEAVFNKFRTVIGDPNQIMRAPETATEQSVLLSKKPVEDPSYQKGDNMSSADTKIGSWTTDVLSRLVAETQQDGPSKA